MEFQCSKGLEKMTSFIRFIVKILIWTWTDIPNTSQWSRRGCAVRWKWAQTILWTRVPLVPRGDLQIWIRFVTQRINPTLEQTQKKTMQVCLHKIGVCLLGKLTICIDNAGALRGPGLYQYWVSSMNNALLPPSSSS